MNKTQYKKIQTILKSFGMYKGVIDGLWGRKSRAAILSFQKVNGLAVDGIIGPKTMGKLYPAPLRSRDIDPILPKPLFNNTWPRQSSVHSYYGDVGRHQTLLQVPYPMKIAWALDKKLTRFSIHEKAHDSALRVFNQINSHYSPSDISKHGFDLFGGCLNVRKMRGGSRYSMHSWGIAIDFDPIRNQFRWGRNRSYLDHSDCVQFWKFWEAEGWLSLGRARNFDWMHVQAARL